MGKGPENRGGPREGVGRDGGARSGCAKAGLRDGAETRWAAVVLRGPECGRGGDFPLCTRRPKDLIEPRLSSFFAIQRIVMWQFLKNLPLFRLFQKAEIDPDTLMEERWVADFSKPGKTRFIPETETTYECSLSKSGLALNLKRGYQMAWVEDPLYRYADLVLEAHVSLETGNGYGAVGFHIRRSDDSTYYSFLLSNKGYFRFDVVFNGTTMPLIGWTEAPDVKAGLDAVHLIRLIALGNKFTIIINDKWAGEISDDTIPAGKIAFSVVSYEQNQASLTGLLRSLLIDSRTVEVEAFHLRWNRFIKIDNQARLRLAETFLAMNQPLSALVEIKQIWKTAGTLRNQEDLLFAARCALQLSLFDEAEEYLNHCLESDIESETSRSAMIEKAKLLYLQGKYADLQEHTQGALEFFPQDAMLHTLLGHAYMNLGRPDLAAKSYDRAFAQDDSNALIAQNAGIAYEQWGNKQEALDRYLRAGTIFLSAENYNDLALLIPRILELGRDHRKAHGLAGKYYFTMEEFQKAEKELELADTMEPDAANDSDSDPALPYLRALLLIRKGKRKSAIPFLKRAVQQAPDSALFHFRLAENLFLLRQNPEDAELWEHLRKSLSIQQDDGWTLNLAAQVEMRGGNLDSAQSYLERAASLLPKEPAVRANQAELAYQQGAIDRALSLLKDTSIEDTEGLLAHQAGSILARSGRLEEAKAFYEEAIKKNPDGLEFLVDYASCLVDLGLYGEADEQLGKAYEKESNESILELIGYIAFKKGEFPRSEGAYRLALEMDPENTNVLSSLAWVYITMGRWSSAEACIQQLEKRISPDSNEYQSVKELRERFLMGTTRLIRCAGCTRSWRVPLDAPEAPPLRLVAQPPDELPAGTCIHCGKTYCIGCAKQSIDESGRFICPDCGERLKLYDEGLKRILSDWAALS